MTTSSKPDDNVLSGGRVVHDGCLLARGEGRCTAVDPCAPCATLWIHRVVIPALASLSLIKDEVPNFFSAYVKAHKAYVGERLQAEEAKREEQTLEEAIEITEHVLAAETREDSSLVQTSKQKSSVRKVKPKPGKRLTSPNQTNGAPAGEVPASSSEVPEKE